MASGLDRQGLAQARRDEDVEIARLGAMPSTGPRLPQNSPQTTRTRVPSSSTTSGISLPGDVLVARRRHLQRRGQVRPQLEAVHAALRVTLRHLLVEDAAAGGHPLHVAGAQRAAVAEAVAVLDRAGQHVGDGLDAAVRMPREAGPVVLGPVVAEIVEQQERVELAGVAEAEGARRPPPPPAPPGGGAYRSPCPAEWT